MKQPRLFADMNDEQPVLELYQPREESLDYWNIILLRNFTVPEMELRIRTFLPLISNKKVIALTDNMKQSTPVEIANIQAKKNNYRKQELSAFLAFFLADLRNFRIYLESLPEDVQMLWRIVIDNYYVSHKEATEKTGSIWITHDLTYGYFSRSVKISGNFAWFNYTETRAEGTNDFKIENKEYYIFLPDLLRTHLHPLFYPDDVCRPVTCAELPDYPLHLFNSERHILREFPIIEGMGKQGMLAMDKTKLSATTFNQAARQLNMFEFFPEETNKYISMSRARFILPLYAFYHNIILSGNISKCEKMEDTLRSFLEEILCYQGMVMPILLPHITGLRTNILIDSYGASVAMTTIQLLKELNTREWISIEKFFLYLRSMETNTCYSKLFTLSDFDKLKLKNTKLDSSIFLNNLFSDIVRPYIKAIFFLLASFGLVEIAYVDYDPSSPSYFCSLRYARITPLGAYVLKLEDSYTQPIIEDKESFFEVDAENLIIRSLSDNNPYEALLMDTAQPIGCRRYRVTFESFLKNCTEEKDVTDKIIFFKRYIYSDLPEVWESFFQSLAQRCNPLQKVPDFEYNTYQIEPKNLELQRLISTDPLLRMYTVRAEKYLLLVQAKHQKEVISRLKSFGYLL